MQRDTKNTKANKKVSNGQVFNNEPEPPVTENKSNEVKTWFDWTEAILLPVVLALLGVGFTAAQFVITNNRQDADSSAKAIEIREQVLTDYAKTISELVTEYKLGQKSNESVKNIARGQTLIALRRLDSGDESKVDEGYRFKVDEDDKPKADKGVFNQLLIKLNLLNPNESKDDTGKLKGLLIRYLYDAKLIGYDTSNGKRSIVPEVIDLSGANINNVVLENAWLPGIDLQFTELKDSNFKKTYLMGANLTEANLTEANLTNAYLRDANITRGNLTNADLTNADLRNANLTKANLGNAKFTPKIIKEACYWEKAIYVPVPDSYGSDYFETAIEKDSKEYKQREIDREANDRKIEEMKQHKDSDPKLSVDCSKWEGK